jgi:hypothetical protein
VVVLNSGGGAFFFSYLDIFSRYFNQHFCFVHALATWDIMMVVVVVVAVVVYLSSALAVCLCAQYNTARELCVFVVVVHLLCYSVSHCIACCFTKSTMLNILKEKKISYSHPDLCCCCGTVATFQIFFKAEIEQKENEVRVTPKMQYTQY